MACPICRSAGFYIKDPDDAYETYEFEWQPGGIRFEDAATSAPTEIGPDREIFCQRCAWHGPLKQIITP